MADRGRDPGPDEGGTTDDGFIEELIPDPVEVPDLRVVAGFLGRSAREGYTRLYLTLELNDYLEIADEDIVHRHQVASASLPADVALVWVDATATIERKSVVSRRAQADFLIGEITASVGRSVISAAAPIPMLAPSLLGPMCVSALPVCAPSLIGPMCVSTLPVCGGPSPDPGEG